MYGNKRSSAYAPKIIPKQINSSLAKLLLFLQKNEEKEAIVEVYPKQIEMDIIIYKTKPVYTKWIKKILEGWKKKGILNNPKSRQSDGDINIYYLDNEEELKNKFYPEDYSDELYKKDLIDRWKMKF